MVAVKYGKDYCDLVKMQFPCLQWELNLYISLFKMYVECIGIIIRYSILYCMTCISCSGSFDVFQSFVVVVVVFLTDLQSLVESVLQVNTLYTNIKT